jgi:hypothetical protein
MILVLEDCQLRFVGRRSLGKPTVEVKIARTIALTLRSGLGMILVLQRNAASRMTELEILIAVFNLIETMTAWPIDHTQIGNDTRAECQRYEAFLIWLLKGIGLDEESAHDLAKDPQNVRWDESQDAIRAFLCVEYEEVAKLLAAGAKRIERLNKWLDSTAVEPVNLPIYRHQWTTVAIYYRAATPVLPYPIIARSSISCGAGEGVRQWQEWQRRFTHIW